MILAMLGMIICHVLSAFYVKTTSQYTLFKLIELILKHCRFYYH